MLLNFFYTLRNAGLPVSVREYLALLEGLKKGLIGPHIQTDSDLRETRGYASEDFYYLSRTSLIKDEQLYDKFDRAFSSYFNGLPVVPALERELPADWLQANQTLQLDDEQLGHLEKLEWQTLMETLRQRLEEQKERHAGGNKWIGTGGTSPFGAYGQNPQGIRIGQASSRTRSAAKVWDQRAYRDYDDTHELGTRNIKLALRRLRKFARQGNTQELDLPQTIRSTAANAGMLDIRMQAPRHNHVKVLLLLDVGGTMDEHITRVEELFSACRSEFLQLDFYYFHNCVYDFVWKNNRRRFAEKFDTWDLLRKYNRDYKLVFVGDATMGPHEILQAGGSVEYNNQEAGATWLERLTSHFTQFAWINPEPQEIWQYRQSISLVQQLLQQRMYPLNLVGLEQAMRQLSK